ncbi:hypothetical protein ACG2LH_05350 [Zhouia sp. PK063]|uniref:hypothetical protein n=1 Tax=Zhouia sp. PK063 TaxID=3373602 RepID=UPI0037A422FE
MIKYILHAIIFICCITTYAQTTTVSGVVNDSTGAALSYTNILAQPVADSLQMAERITNYE